MFRNPRLRVDTGQFPESWAARFVLICCRVVIVYIRLRVDRPPQVARAVRVFASASGTRRLS